MKLRDGYFPLRRRGRLFVANLLGDLLPGLDCRVRRWGKQTSAVKRKRRDFAALIASSARRRRRAGLSARREQEHIMSRNVRGRKRPRGCLSTAKSGGVLRQNPPLGRRCDYATSRS